MEKLRLQQRTCSMWSSFQQSAAQGHVCSPAARNSCFPLPKTSHQQASLSQYFWALFQNRQARQDLVVGTERNDKSARDRRARKRREECGTSWLLMALDFDPPVRDRFPAARGTRSLNFWRRSRILQGLKRRGVSGSGIYRDFLVGYAVWLFSDSTFVTVAIDLGRPTSTAFASSFPLARPRSLCPCHRRLLALAMPFPSVFHRPTDNVYISGNPIYFMYPNKSDFYLLSRAC